MVIFMLYQPVQIGPVHLEGNIFAAPLAGYTNAAYRSLCLAHHANLAFSEMISCEGLLRESTKTLEYAQRADNEKFLALQLFGGNEDAIEKAIPVALQFNPAIIDFNAGCPMPKVNRSWAGSALLQHPELLARLVKLLRKNIPAHVAVTVKIRNGWNDHQLNYLDVADRLLQAGADMITLHPRTREQGYNGRANWDHLALLKKTFPTAIICGSGDLFSAHDAQHMLEQTGVDAVMFARGMLGNPHIFTQTRALLSNQSMPQISPYDQLLMAKEHLKLVIHYHGGHHAGVDFKKHLLVYLKGLPGLKPTKELVSQMISAHAMMYLIDDLLDRFANADRHQ
jgi:tRNA-dihydrouridine synthase B